MSEWGIPFDYIETHWTKRQLSMHAARLAERLERENQRQARGQRGSKHGESRGRRMKYKDMLHQRGII